MKISLSEQGGWSAGIPTTPQVLDLTALDETTAQEGRKLVEQLMNHPPAAMAENLHARDESEVTIRVDEQGDSRELTMKSMSMTREFADLLSWLKQRLREKRGD